MRLLEFWLWQGAKFPWESAATGREVCPEKIYGEEEIHINGDVMLAFEQYYQTTQVTGRVFCSTNGTKLAFLQAIGNCVWTFKKL